MDALGYLHRLCCPRAVGQDILWADGGEEVKPSDSPWWLISDMSLSNSVIFTWNSLQKLFSYQADFFFQQETEDIVEAAEKFCICLAIRKAFPLIVTAWRFLKMCCQKQMVWILMCDFEFNIFPFLCSLISSYIPKDVLQYFSQEFM